MSSEYESEDSYELLDDCSLKANYVREEGNIEVFPLSESKPGYHQGRSVVDRSSEGSGRWIIVDENDVVPIEEIL